MKTKNIDRIAATTIALALTATAQAANIAYDNASAFAYDNGWQTGDNGGYGWGPWTLNAIGNAGFFVGTSTGNGNMIDDGNVGGVPGDDDIDTTVGPVPDQSTPPLGMAPNLTALRSLGMWAESFSTAEAFRSFTGGPLTVGQSFSTAFDTGFIFGGGTVGIGLLNAAGETLWELSFVGGSSFYRYQDGSGIFDTAVEFGTEGLALSVLLTSPGVYEMDLVRADGMSYTATGPLAFLADQDIAQIRVFNDGAGPGFPRDFFINNMEVIPEPSSAMLALTALVLPLLRRCR